MCGLDEAVPRAAWLGCTPSLSMLCSSAWAEQEGDLCKALTEVSPLLSWALVSCGSCQPWGLSWRLEAPALQVGQWEALAIGCAYLI